MSKIITFIMEDMDVCTGINKSGKVFTSAKKGEFWDLTTKTPIDINSVRNVKVEEICWGDMENLNIVFEDPVDFYPDCSLSRIRMFIEYAEETRKGLKNKKAHPKRKSRLDSKGKKIIPRENFLMRDYSLKGREAEFLIESIKLSLEKKEKEKIEDAENRRR